MKDEDKENDEVIESQISKRDRKEIERGACVNCAIASFVITILMMVVMIL